MLTSAAAQKCAILVELEKMLQIILQSSVRAKIGFDTAENEPNILASFDETLQHMAKIAAILFFLFLLSKMYVSLQICTYVLQMQNNVPDTLTSTHLSRIVWLAALATTWSTDCPSENVMNLPGDAL